MIRLSEDNTKKKLVFFELSSESILDEVKGSKLFGKPRIPPHLFLYHLAKEKRNDWRHYSFIHSFLSFFPSSLEIKKMKNGMKEKGINC